MTNIELILTMLAEASATEISVLEQPDGFQESAKVAVRGASVAKIAKKQIEEETGKSAVSSLNAKTLGQRKQLGLKKGRKDLVLPRRAICKTSDFASGSYSFYKPFINE
jgi:hypothetical protein